MKFAPRGSLSILFLVSTVFTVAGCSSKKGTGTDPSTPEDAAGDIGPDSPGLPDGDRADATGPDPDADPLCSPIPCTTACETPGEEACLPNGAHAECVGEELCNGCDDDGDEEPDDDLFCALGERRTCTTLCGNSGVEVCADDCSDFNACTVNTEECDGTDSDDDGVRDSVPAPVTVEHSCLTTAGYELTGFVADCSESPEVHILGVYEGERPVDACESDASCTCHGAGCAIWKCDANACSGLADSSGGVDFTCSDETCRLDFEGSGGTRADCSGSENCWVKHSGSGGCEVACGEHCVVQGGCTVTCPDGEIPVTTAVGTTCGGGLAAEPSPPSLRQVNVTVNRQGVPVILVLSAYTDTNWLLDVKEGVDLERIITTGHGVATVEGLETEIPVEDVNLAACAYEWPAADGCRTDCLVEGAEALTGRTVTSFHGCYHSTSFSIQ